MQTIEELVADFERPSMLEFDLGVAASAMSYVIEHWDQLEEPLDKLQEIASVFEQAVADWYVKYEDVMANDED